MADFKLCNSFLLEVSSFSSAGTALNDDYGELAEGSLSTLTASQLYLRQHKQIKELIDAYICLLKEDVKDLSEMQKTAMKMDDQLARSFGQ